MRGARSDITVSLKYAAVIVNEREPLGLSRTADARCRHPLRVGRQPLRERQGPQSPGQHVAPTWVYRTAIREVDELAG